jgi:hypothetical protein
MIAVISSSLVTALTRNPVMIDIPMVLEASLSIKEIVITALSLVVGTIDTPLVTVMAVNSLRTVTAIQSVTVAQAHKLENGKSEVFISMRTLISRTNQNIALNAEVRVTRRQMLLNGHVAITLLNV